MSETIKKRNAAIACGEMKQEGKGIIVEQGNYGPSKNEIINLAGMEIKVEGYEIAGKTGTAQKYENNQIAQGKYVASFIGYYPANEPQYMVLIIVDEPQGAYYGGVVAAPIAKQVFEAIFNFIFD